MSAHDSALAYRQSSAFGATPVGQVIALYDTILRDLHRANSALAASQIEQRVTAVNHALLVIGELQGVLDFERGGEPAQNLDSFYKVARNLILQASVNGSGQTFQEVISMVTRLRAAWARVEHDAAATDSEGHHVASTPLRRISVPKGNTAVLEEMDAPARVHWKA